MKIRASGFYFHRCYYSAIYFRIHPPPTIFIWVYSYIAIEEWTKKTPNPKCWLFFKSDLLTDFAALCLTDFIDWSYIHLSLVFSTQFVNCCPHGRRNYTCVLLPLYLLSDLPPPPLPRLSVQYTQTGVAVGGVGVLKCVLCRSFTRCFRPDSEPTKLLHTPQAKWPVKTTKFLHPCVNCSYLAVRCKCNIFSEGVEICNLWWRRRERDEISGPVQFLSSHRN